MIARPTFIIVILISSWITAVPASARSGEARPKYDGNWWQAANSDERTGFLYALDDCLTIDKTNALRFDDTWDHYEREITQYYSVSAAHRASLVQSTFERFGKQLHAVAGGAASERYGDEFWRAHNEWVRRGFIEGYIQCRAKEHNGPKWSKDLTYYLHAIDDLYQVDDRHGENAPEYSGSVASALDKMKDQPPPHR